MRRFFQAFLLASVLAAAPALAQQFPSQQRGLSADTAYQSGELDSVNLFNGNLSLAVPLGQPYPVGGPHRGMGGGAGVFSSPGRI